MRRMINNTTAIAACLSLLVPHAALAQGAPAGGEQPPVPPVQEQPAPEAADPAAEPQQQPPAAAKAEPAAPVAEPAAQAEPQPEAAAAEAEPQPEPAPAEVAAEPAPAAADQAAPEPAPAEVPQAAQAPEPAAEPQPEPQAAEAPAEAEERPAPAQREQQQERPAQAENRPADQEGKPQRAQERAARQADQEEATRQGQAERPAAAARQQQQEPPAQADTARQQEQERPAAAARDQQAERPQTAPAEADPLREALEAEQNNGQQPAAPANDPARTQAQDAPAAADAPDEDELRDALTRDQASPPAAAGQAAAEGQAQPPAAAAQPAEAPQANAPESGAPVTDAARQAAQETAAPTAAALNEDRQGEVVEQQITEENSRSSDEDFATSLREALAPQAEQPAAQANEAAQGNDDDDDNDLAKALLLGLGAVAVGTYLNNNRQVALSAPDRVVVTHPDGSQQLIKDEVALLRQPGSTVTTENFDDGSSRTVVTRSDGSRVVTIRDADLRVLRRTLVSADGTQTRLIDDTTPVEPVDVATLPQPAPVAPTGAFQDEAALREALQSEVDIDRRFTLGQVRTIPEVRALVPPVTIDAITFDTGSAAISPDQARQLSTLGNVIQDAIAQNPREMFLIEGHTDTVGADAANLALSDRRAESVALALTEYFDVPPENMVVQGYGEQFPQVRQEGDVRENRRAAVRRITGLLQTAEAQ